MTINKYEKSDIEKIELLGSILHDNYKFDLDTYSSCFVLKENNTLIGFITFSIMYERAEIIDIVVNENYRNNGYGTMLFKAALKEITENNCDNVTLEVDKTNKNAIKFYENNDFKIVSIRKKYYNNSDGYLMKKDLR